MTPSQEVSRGGRAIALAILVLVALCLAIFTLARFPKNDFKSKFNRIEVDMTETEVDQLLEGLPVYREELIEVQREMYGPPEGPCIRTPFFRKSYAEKPDAIERDYYIEVYFDQNYMVVHKMLGEYIK